MPVVFRNAKYLTHCNNISRGNNARDICHRIMGNKSTDTRNIASKDPYTYIDLRG